MRKGEWAVLIIVLISVATGWFFYPQLPPVVASHWDAGGNANGYMSKEWAISLFPVILAIFFVIFLIIPRVDPKRENIAKFRKYFDYFIIAVSLFVYYFFLISIFWNLGYPFNFVTGVVPAFAFLFWMIGILLPHTELNWTIGIRTPWTISSENVWKKTHRIGGILFKAAALISLLGALLPTIAIWLVIVPIIAATIGLVIYSYVLYEREGKI